MLTAHSAQSQDSRTAAGARVAVPAAAVSRRRPALWSNDFMTTCTLASFGIKAHGRRPEEVPS